MYSSGLLCCCPYRKYQEMGRLGIQTEEGRTRADLTEPYPTEAGRTFYPLSPLPQRRVELDENLPLVRGGIRSACTS